MTFLDSRTLIFIAGSMSGMMALAMDRLQRNSLASIRGGANGRARC